MAVITSAANGLRSTPGTWVGGVAPQIGDSAIIAHDVTWDTVTPLGTSPAAGGNVLTIQTGKSLTINQDLFLRGGFVCEGTAQIYFAAGHGIEFDPSNAAVPGTAAYLGIVGNTHNSTPGLVFNGVLGSPCFIRTKAGSATAAYAQITDGTGPWLQAGLMNGQYVTFQRLGDASRPAALISVNNATVSLQHVLADNCGEFSRTYAVGATGTLELIDWVFTNSLATSNLTIGASAVLTAGNREVSGCSFDKTIHSYPGKDFIIEGNFFEKSLDTIDGDWASFKDNFLRIEDAFGMVNLAGHATDNYLFYDQPGQYNPHFLAALKYGRSQSVLRNIFDCSCNQPAQEGDCVSLDASCPAPSLLTFDYNIIVRGPADKTVGTPISALGNANTSFTANHNTYFTGNQGIAVGESYAGFPGMCTGAKSNNVISKLGGEGYKFYDSGANDPVVDLVTAANLNYNNGFGLLAGSNLKGYNNLEFGVGTPGANDFNVDPQLVDDTRSLITWSTYQGGDGSVGDAISRIKANVALIANLYAWVRDGFKVQNPALNNAGHDGITVGAMPFVSAASITASPTSLVGGTSGNIVTVNGVGTTWTPGTPGAPVFSVSGVTGATVTAQTVNNATSATLTVTSSSGLNVGTITVSDGTNTSNGITVVPDGYFPVPGKDEFWAMGGEWYADYMDPWFISNNHPANDTGLAQAFYDGEMCAYRLKDHFGTAEFDNVIEEEYLAYVPYYVVANGGGVQGFRNFTDGPLEDVLRATSRAVGSLNAINLILVNGAYVASGDLSDTALSRECAYALTCHINATLAGIVLSPTQITRRDQLKAWCLGHIDQWAINLTAPYFRPFMGGLTAKALIHYYENVVADPAIIVKLKAMADYAWTTCWKSTSGDWGAGNSFLYTDRILPGDVEPQDGYTAPDLNNLVSPLWGWLFKMGQGSIYRTNGDLIFQGGIPVYDGAFHVSGAEWGSRSPVGPSGKRLNQSFYWGPKYIEYAETIQLSTMSVSPIALNANSVGSVVTVTGIGTNWAPGMPGSPLFSLSGVSGAEITSQVVNSATSATLTINSSTNNSAGTLVISDGTIVANGISVVALTPPTGTNSRRRPYR